MSQLWFCAVTDSAELHVHNAAWQQPNSSKDVCGLYGS